MAIRVPVVGFLVAKTYIPDCFGEMSYCRQVTQVAWGVVLKAVSSRNEMHRSCMNIEVDVEKSEFNIRVGFHTRTTEKESLFYDIPTPKKRCVCVYEGFSCFPSSTSPHPNPPFRPLAGLYRLGLECLSGGGVLCLGLSHSCLSGLLLPQMQVPQGAESNWSPGSKRMVVARIHGSK